MMVMWENTLGCLVHVRPCCCGCGTDSLCRDTLRYICLHCTISAYTDRTAHKPSSPLDSVILQLIRLQERRCCLCCNKQDCAACLRVACRLGPASSNIYLEGSWKYCCYLRLAVKTNSVACDMRQHGKYFALVSSNSLQSKIQ